MLAGRFALPSWRKDVQTVALRGSKSRNKVSVGEPAEGSLKVWFRASGADRMLWQTKSGRSGCFVETKAGVVPWLGSQPRSLPRAQDLSVLGCKPLTPRVDLFWSQGRSFGCPARGWHPATGFQRVLASPAGFVCVPSPGLEYT